MNHHHYMKKLLMIFSCGFLCHAPLTHAEINLNGFATLTAGQTMASDERLNGYDDDSLFEQDSFLGLQANANLGDGLTAVAQVVSRGNDSWDAKLEWAYVGYEVNDNLKILAGRQRMPFYLYSSYLDVGYTYHWVSPPETTYSVPFNSATGLGVLLTNEIGDASSTLHLVYGRNKEKFDLQGDSRDSDISNMMGVAWTVEYDWLTFRAGYSESDLSIDIDSLQQLGDGWAQAGAGFSQATSNPAYAEEWAGFSDNLTSDDGNDTGSFGGVAVAIDYDNFVAVAEYTTLQTEGSIIQKEGSGYYLSLGYRFGDIMPHATYGTNEIEAQDDSFLDGPIALNSLLNDPSLAGLIATTSGIINEPTRDQTYFIVGVRWDFHPSAAVKLGYKSQKEKLPVDKTNNLLRLSLVTVF